MSLKNNIYGKMLLSIVLFVVFSTPLLSGCERNKESFNHSNAKPDQVRLKKSPSIQFLGGNLKIPISSGKERLFAVNGWLDDRTVVYQTESANGGSIFSYDLLSGESKLLFASNSPIVTVKISPSMSYILIHYAPQTYLGSVSIIDRSGKLFVTKEIESAELEFAWNYFDENELLISAFDEDWSFQTFQLDVRKQSLTNLDLKQPFLYWLTKKDVIYLDWDADHPSFFAPLIKTSLLDGTAAEIVPDIYQVQVFGNQFVTITVNYDEKENAIYTFYSNDLRKVKSIKIPHLTTYSDWLVPFSDYSSTKRNFITFQPLHSESIETYSDGFQLVSYDLITNKQQLIFEGLKNEPISCSPNREFCLYGNYFEKIMNLENKEIMDLFTY